MIDLFAGGLSLPGRVYIVCPGPNGVAAYEKVPRGACVIAVNYGVCAGVKPTYHLVADVRAPWSCWWPDQLPDGVTRIYSRDLAAKGITCERSFNQNPPMGAGKYEPQYGCLRCGAGGLGQALQACHWFMPAKAWVGIIGADLDGECYFDGTVVKAYLGGDHWQSQRRRVEQLVDYLRRQRGMVIESLSETTLRI